MKSKEAKEDYEYYKNLSKQMKSKEAATPAKPVSVKTTPASTPATRVEYTKPQAPAKPADNNIMPTVKIVAYRKPDYLDPLSKFEEAKKVKFPGKPISKENKQNNLSTPTDNNETSEVERELQSMAKELGIELKITPKNVYGGYRYNIGRDGWNDPERLRKFLTAMKKQKNQQKY